MEVQVKCKRCSKEVRLPRRALRFRCSVCQTLNDAISVVVHGQQSEDHGRYTSSPFYTFQSPTGVTGQQIQHRKFRSSMKHFATRLFNSEPYTSLNSPLSYSTILPLRHNKRAVLVGVTYSKKRKFRLKGTINDVKNMKELLMKVFQFPEECIRVLTEEEPCPSLIPTKKNILESLKWLVADSQPGDSLVFYFSGHGLQQPDYNEHELDGFDESLCPADFLQEGMILDNDINSIIVWPLQKGVTLHAIVDACHSGTILDLIYVYNLKQTKWEDHSLIFKKPIRKSTVGGLAICLSACADDQIAADTSAFGGKGMNGVMTYLLAKTIRGNPDITYGALLEKIHKQIEEINNKRCPIKFLRNRNNIIQDPQLSSSDRFDLYSERFIL